MDKNEINETKEAVEESTKLAANVASGNVVGAAKNAVKLSTNGQAKKMVKKMVKRMVIQAAMTIIPILLLASIFLTVVNTVKDGMVQLLNAAQTRISSFWTWFTDDQWIDLEERMITEDNKSIHNNDESSEENTTEYTYTIAEKYLKDLVEQGASLKELKLLGDFDFPEKDQELSELKKLEKILINENHEYDKQKQLIEKYIKEFVRADLISQTVHRRRNEGVVNPSNENEIDGGVYIKRTKNNDKHTSDTGYDQNTGEEVDKITYLSMEYLSPKKFKDKFGIDTEGSLEYGQEIRYTGSMSIDNLKKYYTIDEDTGELVYVQLKTVEKFINDKKEESEIILIPISVDYKQYISKYAMPYEFLVNLCMITENPEFVYHVALLARDTKITLAIQDDMTIEENLKITEVTTANFTNYEENSIIGASRSDDHTDTTTERTVTTTMAAGAKINVRYANAWSFYEQWDYTNTIEIEKIPEELLVTEGPVDTATTLENYEPAEEGHYESVESAYGGEEDVWRPGHDEYWYTEGYVTSNIIKTQTTTTTNTYKVPDKATQSVEKSKQFLGLLRNSEGKCPENCYVPNSSYAKKCVEQSVFNDYGINVPYLIPNSTKKETPLNKLTSGIRMLYQLLGADQIEESTDENGEYIKDSSSDVSLKEDVEDRENITDERDLKSELDSIYVQRMQGIVEHLQYLMTFPPNEQYEVVNDELVYSPDEDSSNNGEYTTNGEVTAEGVGFWWPLNENVICRISSPFGNRDHPVTGEENKMHKGIDIAKGGEISIEGVEVLASADGIVATAQYSTSAGNFIEIDHANGFKTRYLHLQDIVVSVGQQVTRGQVIGHLGNTGSLSTGPHLHFEIWLNEEPQDPEKYVSITNRRPISNNYVPQYNWDGVSTTEFIEIVGEYARQDMKESGVLASVTIAQAMIESREGKSLLSSKYNNYFGVKAFSSWTGERVTLNTHETINGQDVIVKADFKVYNSLQESIKDHSKVLSHSRYNTDGRKVVGETDYVKAVQSLVSGPEKYATDEDYVSTICDKIEKWGLTRFDH